MKANRTHYDPTTGIPAAALELVGLKEPGRFQGRVAQDYSKNPRTVLRDLLGITWAALDELGLDRAAPAKATLAALADGTTDVAAVVEGRWHPPVVARGKKAPAPAVSKAYAATATERAATWLEALKPAPAKPKRTRNAAKAAA